MNRKGFLFALVPALFAGVIAVAAAAPPVAVHPGTASQRSAASGLRTAVFSGGCFWGVQGVFSHVRGVTHALSGYTGGSAVSAHYSIVSTGLTGHAESVQVTYDPEQVSYGDLLRVFFSVAHDPTEVDRQGPDAGSQYRSALWVSSPDERRQAEAYIRQLSARHTFRAPIATRVETLHAFFPAERHHQDFMIRHPDSPYILAWDAEKVAHLRSLFPALYAATPAASS